jgi:hypothetical protein
MYSTRNLECSLVNLPLRPASDLMQAFHLIIVVFLDIVLSRSDIDTSYHTPSNPGESHYIKRK